MAGDRDKNRQGADDSAFQQRTYMPKPDFNVTVQPKAPLETGQSGNPPPSKDD